ncbi:MAG TPA: DUF4350 domain-containing protein [Rhizobacter sp.]|nr:DUF4350 domain-containing protein [Rhizobacter sp.]
MNRSYVYYGLAIALAAAGVAWIAAHTEWVEIDVPTAASGEAAKNDLYALQQLARGLGAEVSTHSDLDRMPPEGASLLLSSWQWDLFPERGAPLRAWVQRGGHLTLFAMNIDSPQLADWLPAQEPPRRSAPPAAAASSVAPDEDDAEDDDIVAPRSESPAASAPLAARLRRTEHPCHTVTEPDDVTESYVPRQPFTLCGSASIWPLKTATPPTWQLVGPKGTEMLRLAYGHGSVTVINNRSVFDNAPLLLGDNAALAAAALQLRRGAAVWFVAEESRTPFLRWLWQTGHAALLLTALAIALAVWRGAVRFGPQTVAPPSGRRSMAEQITGTAQFLWRRGGNALHTAQLRSLDEIARWHVRHYDKLDRGARAQAIARLTGLDAQALGLALDRSMARRRVDLPPVLELLETARRLLAQPRREPRP